MEVDLSQWTKPIPRDYQMEAHDNFFGMKEDCLIQLPCGLGKSITAAIIMASSSGTCLFIAHTEELIRQTCRTMIRVGLWPNVEKAAEYQGSPYILDDSEKKRLFPRGIPPKEWFVHNKVVVASMQTFVNRVSKYEDRPFSLAVVDECHRSRCRTVMSIASSVKQYNPFARLLGLTATPYRSDKKSLGKLFPKFAYRKQISEAIEEGYSVDIRAKQGTMKYNASKLKRAGNDISAESAADAISDKDCIESIAHEIFEHGEGRRGIVFLPNIATTESVCAAINAIKPGTATFVHGKIPKMERRKRMRDMDDGVYQLICGCDILVEGYDCPDLSLAVMGRITGSRGRYEQMLGRVLRVLASSIEGLYTVAERLAGIAKSLKPNCLVLDFANTSRFKLVSAEDVLLVGMDEKVKEFVKKERKKDDPRKLRDQVEELEALYALREAIRVAGEPPPRLDFQYRDVNLFGGGVTSKASVDPKDARRPSTDQLKQAEQFFIDLKKAEKMTSGQLKDEIAKRRETMTGKRNYAMLKDMGINPKEVVLSSGEITKLNWHDATYLRTLAYMRPDKTLPANWPELLVKKRAKPNKDGKK